MYNITLQKNEEIKLISDNTIVYNKDKELLCSSIITNKRYIILDYPGNINNPREDLRILQKMNYIKQKEVIFEIQLDKIYSIEKYNDSYKIIFLDNNYIIVEDKEIIDYLNKKI